MKKRRMARELVVKTLYACEMGAGDDCIHVLDTIVEAKPYDSDIKEYARHLVKKAYESRDAADTLITKHAANWKLERMAAIDRNILRMAIAELRFFNDVPPKVAIDEAVEIAKTYGTEESSRFVNGVVDSIYKELSKGIASE
jgi:N utilization substance protein B